MSRSHIRDSSMLNGFWGPRSRIQHPVHHLFKKILRRQITRNLRWTTDFGSHGWIGSWQESAPSKLGSVMSSEPRSAKRKPRSLASNWRRCGFSPWCADRYSFPMSFASERSVTGPGREGMPGNADRSTLNAQRRVQPGTGPIFGASNCIFAGPQKDLHGVLPAGKKTVCNQDTSPDRSWRILPGRWSWSPAPDRWARRPSRARC